MEKIQNFRKILPLAFSSIERAVSTTAALSGKRNFRKFLVYNKRGTRVVKEAQRTLGDKAPVAIHKRGVRDIGYMLNDKFVTVPERIPEIIVPDLTNCKLKPYVSYRAPDVVQTEFTSLDLFNAVYSKKVIEDFKEAKLNEDGSSKEPSAEENLTPEEALIRARKTGSDIF